MNRPELLLVDDDPIAIEVLSHMLGDFARLRFARTGQEALRLVGERRPDLMLLDVDLPGFSGIEVLQHLRADGAHGRFPVVMITSHRSAELEAQVFEHGAVDFLCKPLTPPQVRSRVQAQLRIQRIAQVVERMPPRPEPEGDYSILVVDDDVGAVQMLKSALAADVSRIRFATDGVTAMKLMTEESPDLVLLDVQMPGLDGFEVCRAMQADPVLRQTPIALITRFSDPDSEARGLELGATDFIAKPFRPAVLRARVRNLLRIKRENELALRALSDHWKRLGAERVSDIVAAASDAVVSFDAARRIVLINMAACEIFGVEVDTVLGQPVSQSLQGLSDLLWQPGDKESGGLDSQCFRKPMEIVTPKGVRCLLEPSHFQIGEGEHAITTLLLRDITQRELAQAAALARIEAETSSRTKAMMISYLAHEIGNPLNGILGFGQLMAADTEHPLPEVHAHRLEKLLSSGWQLHALMRDAMSLSRIEAGVLEVKPQALNAQACAREALDAATAQAELEDLSLRTVLPDIPITVIADPGRLQQCLGNMLSNAVKYNRAGGLVELSVTAEDGTVSFAVRDSGMGMSADQVDHLFEPFNRLGRGDSKVRGTGLGLVISRALAEAMGGEISVKSAVGEGSTFTLRLRQHDPRLSPS